MVTDLHFLAQTVPVFGRRLEADGQSCRFATLKKMLKKKFTGCLSTFLRQFLIESVRTFGGGVRENNKTIGLE